MAEEEVVETPDVELPDNPPEVEDGLPEQEDSRKTEDKTAKRLKDTQAAFTKARQENVELRSKFDELSGKLEILLSQNVKKDELEEDWIDEEKVSESIRNDPAEVIRLFRAQEKRFVDALQRRDQFFTEKLKEYDPSRSQLKEKIAELRKDPDLKGMPEDFLAVMAKKLNAKPEEDAEIQTVGGPRRSASQKKTSIKDTDLYKRIYDSNPANEVI